MTPLEAKAASDVTRLRQAAERAGKRAQTVASADAAPPQPEVHTAEDCIGQPPPARSLGPMGVEKRPRPQGGFTLTAKSGMVLCPVKLGRKGDHWYMRTRSMKMPVAPGPGR